MAEEVLSDALLHHLSKEIDIARYPVIDYAVDLGFDFDAASASNELAIRKHLPQGTYEHLLQQFVATHGRGPKAVQDLIDIFKVKQKKALVNYLEDAIVKHKALKQSGLAEGQSQTGIGAWSKSIWKFVTGATETSPGDTVSSSQRPSASTSVEIPLQDASVAASEVSTSQARFLSTDEHHEDDGKQLPSEKQAYSSVGERVDEANSSRTFLGPQIITMSSRLTERVPDGRPRKRKKKTTRQTDSSDEDERTRGDKQSKSHGSNDDSLGGRPRRRKKGTTLLSFSGNEAKKRTGDKQSKGHGSNDDILGGPPRVLGIDEHPEHGRQTEINSKEAIMNGMAPWNRSRIMVIGPAGVGKTSLIRRLTGQKFNPLEKSTTGAEQNVVTKRAVSRWKSVNDAHTAKDDLLQSIAMDRDTRSHIPRSTGGEENRSDPEIKGSNRSKLGKGSMSKATNDNILMKEGVKRSVPVSSTSENKKIAKISQSITREEITKVKSSKDDITYSIWDFGGQEVYYITHPLFLSWRSLYILVIPLHLELSEEAPRKEHAGNAHKPLKGSAVKTHRTILDLVHFWLMSVYTHAVPYSHLDSTYEPKVLIIGTFAGDKSVRISHEKVESKVQELKVLIGSQPYQKQVLFPICVIDNKSSKRSEVNEIQDRIDGLIKDLEYMKVRKPVKWRTFLTEIEGSSQNTLTVSKARSMLKSWGINNDKEVEDVLKFYHEIGHLVYHQGCELTVLKPQFLNSIVSNIITVIDDKKMKGGLGKHWTDLKENGILSIELIQEVWKEHKGDHDQLKNIINMMIKFDLICEIPEGSDGKRQFFVPCRSSPKLDEWEIHDKDENVEFTIDFHHFLPDGVLHRFYVRMAQWSMKRNPSIKPTFHCREMMFYIDNGHRVVMTNEIHEGHEIKVMIYAVAPFGAPSERTTNRISLNEDIIDYLHETLENLKELWARRIEYRVGIWCPRCADHERKGWIQIRDILKAQNKTASCDKGCAIYVTVSDIQEAFNKGTTKKSADGGDTVSTDRKQDFDDHLKTVAKEIHKEDEIDSLGKELGFKPAEIARYIRTNEKYQSITYMGSLSMLRDWRNRTTRSEERETLKRALIAIKHHRLADDLLNDDMAIEERTVDHH